MKRTATSALIGVATAAVALVATGASPAAPTALKAIKCNSTMKVAVLTPYTGPAAFLGQDQGSWATLAAKNIGAKVGLKVQIVASDSTLDPSVAATAAQKVIADSQVIGVVGPATSGAAAGTSPAFFDAKLAAVSPSATNAALTKSVGGKPKTATAAFFRIVADDSVQGTRDAQYMVNTLKAKKVAVFDAQEPYSAGPREHRRGLPQGQGRLRPAVLGHEHHDRLLLVHREDEQETDQRFGCIRFFRGRRQTCREADFRLQFLGNGARLYRRRRRP